jgi:polyprenyl P-hydroxybenzoate/phenylacrylic acid decarboxylase-like protein
VRLLQLLRGTGIETHLVLTRWGARTLLHETSLGPLQLGKLATRVWAENDQGAAISSGSLITLGMIVAPCSMKTLAEIAHGHTEDLVSRAAEVVLKERRRLVLLVRETPLSDVHLENMLKLSRMGAVIAPPVPAFYGRPRSVDDLVSETASRALDLFGIHLEGALRWDGVMQTPARHPRAKR